MTYKSYEGPSAEFLDDEAYKEYQEYLKQDEMVAPSLLVLTEEDYIISNPMNKAA